ncbi:MAG TPA: methyltransferase domain-containing protein [Longimicrobium sp.]|nr:methyltransferase domain-containing protein [Longimicrobium sp.]
MSASTTTEDGALRTTIGDFPLHEYRIALGGREWSVLHTGSVLTRAEETAFLGEYKDRLPYGVLLWPAALALAHEVASRADAFREKRVLELGAGTGLPGIVAASLGARVVQTDRQEMAMSVCRRNGARNGIAEGVEYRLADWAEWGDDARYDWILGSDVLYGEGTHPHLRRIFETNLAPGGRVLLSDPFRAPSLRLLEALEVDGWKISMAKWSIGEGDDLRRVGLFELAPPP